VKKAYINAIAIRSACGETKETLDAIFSKQSGLVRHDNFVPEKTVCIGRFKQQNTFKELLFSSIDEVLQASNLENFSNTLLLVGSSVGGITSAENIFLRDKNYENIGKKDHYIDVIATTLDDKYNFYDTRSFSTACTSSANALKTAKELINYGAYENVLVVGADEICKTTVFGFSSLGILSDQICTPFQKERKGMNVAEGIAVLLLQNTKEKHSVALVGAGTSSDAYHITNPDPSATGAITAISNALKNADLQADAIDYINAHGTGTQANDTVEAKAIATIFPHNVAVSSTKSNIGHTLGAAGAIEAAISVAVLQQQKLAPQIKTLNSEASLNFVQQASNAKIDYVLSNSFAFGGNNTTLIFGVHDES
jgi:3-oxoacyl-[acyl-carrier-protein] synthase I